MGFNQAPVAVEVTLDAVPLEGRLPPGLEGTLLRNGPNPLQQEPSRHWFFGHGMVHEFRLQGGRVSYRNRWITTRAWAVAAGRDPEGLPDGLANTSIVSHAGALLALEEAHSPVGLEPESLATLRAPPFAARLPTGPFTAHPKPCPVSGNLVFFGYGAEGPMSAAIRVGEVTPAGRLAWLDTLTAPFGGAMIHDFAVTARYIAIPVFPLVLAPGCGSYAWRPELGAALGVIDRAAGPGSLRWIAIPRGFAFHVANAWDEGRSLVIDLMLADAPALFPLPADLQPASTAARLTRWSVDLSEPAPGLRQVPLSSLAGEFPRIDERWSGRRNRHVFWSTGTALCARDDHTGVQSQFVLEDGDTVSEPVFAAVGTAEADGWILAVVFRAATRTSELAILPAQDLASGPVALAKLPVRVPDGFHGAWIGAAS